MRLDRSGSLPDVPPVPPKRKASGCLHEIVTMVITETSKRVCAFNLTGITTATTPVQKREYDARCAVCGKTLFAWDVPEDQGSIGGLPQAVREWLDKEGLT